MASRAPNMPPRLLLAGLKALEVEPLVTPRRRTCALLKGDDASALRANRILPIV